MIGWSLDDEKELWRAICAPGHWHKPKTKTPATHPLSLYYFVNYVWGVDAYLKNHPEQPRWFYEPIHRPFLSWLQDNLLEWRDAARSGTTSDLKQLAVILPRGYGKTVTASKSAMLWLSLDEPDLSVLLCSSTQTLAEDLLKAIGAVMGGDEQDCWFDWLYGNWRHGAQAWTKSYITHAHRKARNISEPSFDITSVDTGMTGYHHRVHVWDDPVYANKLRDGKEAYLRSVHTAVNASYNAIQANGLLMLVLTRYLDGDVAGRQLRDGGIRSWRGMPCVNSQFADKVDWGRGVWDVYFMQTEDESTGEPTHPVLWTRDKIAAHKRRDPEDFACQQQNNPGSTELAPLTEQKVTELYMDYKDAQFTVDFDSATLHIDTAFKTPETVRSGDYSVIVPWLHSDRRDGKLYLDTDLLQASNIWTEEQFNVQLVKTFIALRRRGIRVRALTDEKEPGGKVGTYKNRIVALIKAGGFPHFSPEQFHQFARVTNKKARIRTAAGHFMEGFVRILLHKDSKGDFIVPPVVRELIRQFCRIDVVDHDDLADAATDGFTDIIWRRPVFTTDSDDKDTPVYNPGDEYLKAFSRPLTNEEVLDIIDSDKSDGFIYSPLSEFTAPITRGPAPPER